MGEESVWIKAGPFDISNPWKSQLPSHHLPSKQTWKAEDHEGGQNRRISSWDFIAFLLKPLLLYEEGNSLDNFTTSNLQQSKNAMSNPSKKIIIITIIFVCWRRLLHADWWDLLMLSKACVVFGDSQKTSLMCQNPIVSISSTLWLWWIGLDRMGGWDRSMDSCMLYFIIWPVELSQPRFPSGSLLLLQTICSIKWPTWMLNPSYPTLLF